MASFIKLSTMVINKKGASPLGPPLGGRLYIFYNFDLKIIKII